MTELLDVFIQVIEADAGDRTALREHWERWVDELAPGAEGWLGSTAGITDDGRFLGLVRFASDEAARRNSHRDEQNDWWQQLRRTVQGEVTVRDCADVGKISDGGSDDAGYVVVVQGRSTDLVDVLHRVAETEESAVAGRPVLLGGYVAAHEDGEGFTEVLYFHSEKDADEVQDKVESEISHLEEMSGYVTDLRRLKLRDPWLHSA